MAEGCMSYAAHLTDGQRKKLTRLILLSLQTDADNWYPIGDVTWMHDGLGISVAGSDFGFVIWDRNQTSQLISEYKTSRFLRWLGGPDDIDLIWDIIHEWRHAEIEARGEAILAKFDQVKTAPEVSRLKELVDATRS